jgi:hypothetical protein
VFREYSGDYSSGDARLAPRGTPLTDQRRDAEYVAAIQDAERLCMPTACDKKCAIAISRNFFASTTRNAYAPPRVF